MTIRVRERWAFAALSLCFALLCCLHNLRTPLWEGPDEGDNLAFVRYLALEQRLPQPTVEPRFDLEHLGRGHMPPLWFASLLPLYRALGAGEWQPTPTLNPRFLRHLGADLGGASSLEAALAEPDSRSMYRHGRDELEPLSGAALDLRLLRLASLPWALLALWACWRAARVLAPDRPEHAFGAAALLALTPQYQHLSATLTMDLMLAAFGSLSLWCALEWCAGRGPATRMALFAGAFAGAACMVKLNGLVLLPALAIAWACARSTGRARFASALACASGLLLVAGPYYAWGWGQSGHPLWMWKYQQLSPFHHPTAEALAVHGFEKWKWFWTVLFLSWLGDFGWTSVWFAGWINALVALAMLAGALAFAHSLFQPAGGCCGRRTVSEFKSAGALLVLAGVLILAAEVYFNLSFSQPQARHMYPFLPALVIPVALGWARLRMLWIALAAHALLSLLAFPLLLERLRPAGWNEDPRWSATDEGRPPRAELREPSSAAAIAWLLPEEGASFAAEQAPQLAWSARAGALYDLVLAVDNPDFEDRPWREHGHVFRARADLGLDLSGPADGAPCSFAIPPSFWSELAPGQRAFVQAIELGADGRARAWSSVRVLERR